MTKKITATMAALILSTVAASAIDLARSGNWSSYITNTKSGPVCGMTTGGYGKAFHVKWWQGNEYISIQLMKLGWRIPRGTEARVMVGFDGDYFGDATATGFQVTEGRSDFGVMQLQIGPDLAKQFLIRFGESNKMEVRFPDGTEAAWIVDMTGSREIRGSFATCVSDLNKSDKTKREASQPFGKQPDSQPFGKQPSSTKKSEDRDI